MPYLGILKRSATCAICKIGMDKGEVVYFDGTKNQGSHLVHQKCWDDLRATRERAPFSKKPIISSEPLDPPF